MSNIETPRIKKFILLFFIFISFIVYFKVLNGHFILDDYTLIVNNQNVKHLKTALAYFFTNIFNIGQDAERIGFFYRPVQMFTYFLNYALGGLNTFGYHLINILNHCFNAYLIFLIINKLLRDFKLGVLSGLIFLLHPLNISSVSYISGRADLLVTFFILLGTLCFIDYLIHSSQQKYIIAIICCILALLSRENGLLMPLFLGLCGLFLKIKKSRLIFSIVPFILLDVLYLFVRFAYLDPGVYIYYSYAESIDILTKLLNFIYLMGNYLVLYLFPRNLHIFRMVPVITRIFSFETVPTIIFLLAAFLLIYYKRKNKIFVFCLFWILFGFLPLWHNMFINLTFESHRLNMAESWTYISCIGFSCLLAYVLLKLPSKPISYLTAASLVFFYGGVTFTNQKYWADDLIFYRHNLKFSPDNYILRNNFISVLRQHKYYTEAEGEAKRYIIDYPNNVLGYNMLSEIYLEIGHDNKAQEQLKRVLEIDPSQMWARRALNDLDLKIGKANPTAPAHDPFGLTFEEQALYYLNKGDLVGAADACSKGIKGKPTAKIYVLSGIVFLKAGKLKSAINVFKRALDLEPQNLEALINLSYCYQMLNKKQEVLRLEKEIEKIKKNR